MLAYCELQQLKAETNSSSSSNQQSNIPPGKMAENMSPT